ncbi:PTS lactose/cellobiose transporter subunit IIA [Enterococcus faecalis]|uniref:PTS lactose/cellobiose transporter subunit IIA n=1 Tax=Enterococcus faecalis TaxID=1351 RepID=UPI0012E1C0E2|nr:PTS lactose/cellobiose transporter subunit IIA [Enterococcus faecalis]EGO5016481.1 PTS lactose/cellobiose transporter subunit IIA [Enterococcus faecalis]EGO6561352.1 PTS lactose/cellobiose transporter subunit IIA [Enterococcus faecalis]EGO7560953.1 PTS lactose/cellobiose transporter subunit IIA [Enterococcus faecalis]EGO7742725.1 PTS lactose/cellobiose transporter subunit IIA [Enterococcus faecalis]EGO8387410.1 PTS lactose/cellobiose transporter subunit IIA [Enterococcus faecalis]
MVEQRKLEQIMGLIIHGGNAKSDAMEAITAGKEGDFDKANKLLKSSNDELKQAHRIQSFMLQQEAEGSPIELTLLTVHSQDHLMNAITTRDLAKEIIDLHHKIELYDWFGKEGKQHEKK